MSISDEISRITNARDDIGDAIEEMGVEVPSGTQIDGMASLIRTGVTGHIQNYNNPHQVTAAQTGAVPVYGMGENLLDNWYFPSPVNQRGQSSYTFTTATYAISRWKLNRATITLGATGINFVWNGNMNYATFLQPNARYDAVAGRKVTLSALTANGDFYSETITVPSSGSSETPAGDPVRFIATANSKSLGILISTTTGVVIVAVKAELGTQQTLCHNEGTDESPVWVLNEIPDYESELMKCKTSTADPADIYANKVIATNASKPNLLRNWYFVGGGTGRGVFPVNQRGETTYTGNGYHMDGWINYNNPTLTLGADGVTISGTNLAAYANMMRQIIATPENYRGKTLTLSVLMENATAGIYVAINDGSVYLSSDSVAGTNLLKVTGTVGSSATELSVNFYNRTAGASPSFRLVAAKLEIGTEQTLAHQENGTWVLNEIPNYEEELIKCQTSVITGDAYANKTLLTSDDLTAATQVITDRMVSFSADLHSVLNECTAAIEPAQDLNGYDYPWPAGSGSNQLDFNNCVYARCTLVDAKTGSVKLNITDNYYASINLEGSQLPTNMINRVLSGGSITLSVVGNLESSSIGIIAYGNRSNGTVYQESSSNGNTVTLTPSLFTTVTRMEFRLCRKGSTYTDTETVISEIQVIYGSSSVPFTPYSNICPISGWKSINIWRTSTQLFEPNLITLNTTQVINGITFSINQQGRVLPTGTATGDTILKLGVITLPPGTYGAYGIRGVAGSLSTYRLVVTNSDFTQALAYVTSSTGSTFTLTKTTTIGYEIVISEGTTVSSSTIVFEPVIKIYTGSNTFLAYSGTTYHIAFPASAGTVYGGTLDVTNGILTVDRAIVDLGTLNWAQYRTVRGWYVGFDKVKAGTNKIICTSYRSVASSTDSSFFGNISNDKCINTYLNDKGLRIMDTAYEDTSTFKASLSGAQLVYELETPIVYNITARQIPYTPQTYIWTDISNITVRYQPTGRNAILTHVSTPVSNLQGQINVSGLLKGNGDGDIVTAIPGQDYAVSKNLLRNWYFVGDGSQLGDGVFPINQRGRSSYTKSVSSSIDTANYCIDGWMMNRGTNTLTSTGMNCVWNGNSDYQVNSQIIPNYTDYAGKNVTMSVLTSDGTLYKHTHQVPSSSSYISAAGPAIRFGFSPTKNAVYFTTANTSGITVVAAKLELGTEQTLCHQENGVWVLNEIPDYEEELIKCQTSTADSNDTYANKSLATEQQVAPIETGTTASRAYATGEYFCWNGLFYKAKTEIASGATFTVGTNCEITNISTELNNTNRVYKSKTFTGIIGTSNDFAGAYFFYGKIIPTDYYTTWAVRYRVKVVTAAQDNSKSQHEVFVTGSQSNMNAYASFNTIVNTSYRAIYHNVLYRATSAGISGNYGHLLGVRLQSAWNPTTAANRRTITIEILQCINCEFTFFNSMTPYANVPGTGSTNYSAMTEMNGTDNGLQETGDANTVTTNAIAYTSTKALEACYRYQIILRAMDGSAIPVSSANNTFTIGKTYSTQPFNPFGEIYYYNSTTATAANGIIPNSILYRQAVADLRYAFDLNASATYKLVANQAVYLTATLQPDGSAILTKPTGSKIGPLATQLPSTNDGLIYIYLGQAYNDTYPYRVELTSDYHPIFRYINGSLEQYHGPINKNCVYYGVCSTPAATTIKQVNIPEITNLYSGLSVRIFFVNVNTVASPKLQINTLAATPICWTGTTGALQYEWTNDIVLDLVYDTYSNSSSPVWKLVDHQHASTNRWGIVLLNESTIANASDAASSKAVRYLQAELAPIEANTTASKAYTTGQYFSKSGNFCRALTDIAKSATFTLNTNYVSTKIADWLPQELTYNLTTSAKFTSLSGRVTRVGNMVILSFRGVASAAMSNNAEIIQIPYGNPGSDGQILSMWRGNTTYTCRINAGTVSNISTGRIYINTAISANDNISITGIYFL